MDSVIRIIIHIVMKYKDGVFVEVIRTVGNKLKRLQLSDEMVQAMEIADVLSKKISGQEAVVTSVLDGVHSKNSLHYVGKAFDLRIWIYTEEQIHLMVENLKSNLGSDYDIILEEDHIHVEYDPCT